MLRIGVIGLGYWGPESGPLFSGHPGLSSRVSLRSRSRETAPGVRRFPDVIGTSDDAEVLRRDRVDAVVIATPTKTHYGWHAEHLSWGSIRLSKSLWRPVAMSVRT